MDQLFPIIDQFIKHNNIAEIGLEQSCLQILEIYMLHLRKEKLSIAPDQIEHFKSETIADIQRYIQVKSYGK